MNYKKSGLQASSEILERQKIADQKKTSQRNIVEPGKTKLPPSVRSTRFGM